MRRRWRLILGIAISLACLYYVVRGIEPHTLWEVYREANYLYLVPAAFVLVLDNCARAYRWRLLMYPDRSIPLRRLFAIVNIGYLFNNVLPAKVGEVVRAYLVGRMLPGGIGQGLSTLIVERLLDVLTMVVLLASLVPFLALPGWAVKGGILLGSVALIGLVVLLILARFGERGLDWVWRIVGRLPVVGTPRVKLALQNLLIGFRVLTVGRILPGVILSSAVVWLGYATLNYVMSWAFGLGHLSFAVIVFVLCASAFGMVLPSSPGGIGPFEAGIVLALSLYGVDQSRAFGYAFGLHAFTNIVLILLGLGSLRSESLTFGGLRSQVAERAPAREADAAQS